MWSPGRQIKSHVVFRRTGSRNTQKNKEKAAMKKASIHEQPTCRDPQQSYFIVESHTATPSGGPGRGERLHGRPRYLSRLKTKENAGKMLKDTVPSCGTKVYEEKGLDQGISGERAWCKVIGIQKINRYPTLSSIRIKFTNNQCCSSGIIHLS